MACFGRSESSEEREKRKVNKRIDIQLREEKDKYFNKTIRLLLLGAGESGKSTIVKQMKIIHKNGFTAEELESNVPLVLGNTVKSLQQLLSAMKSERLSLGVEFQDEKLSQAAGSILHINVDNLSIEEFIINKHDIMNLWNAVEIQQVYRQSSKFQLLDSAKYFLSSVERIAEPNYVPTDQDILRSRIQTTGIVETSFEYKSYSYIVTDVGGQRSERKKWIHCFDNVTAIIFVVALSGYDLTLRGYRANRMQEAMKIFASICNNSWFDETSMIIFLNKTDIFEEKIKTTPISVCFPEFPGPHTAEDSRNYIAEVFKRFNNNPVQKQFYIKYTCATDTENMKFVFAVITDIIIHQKLKTIGLV